MMLGVEIREENCSDCFVRMSLPECQGEQFAGSFRRICQAAKADGADVRFRSDICKKQHEIICKIIKMITKQYQ